MKLNYLAALSSVFIAGLGQILLGQTNNGIRVMLGFYFLLPGIIYLSLLVPSPIIIFIVSSSIFLAAILWVYSIIGALFYREKNL